jgi:sodium/hydrogen antiporter
VSTGLWYVTLGALFVAYALSAARLNRVNVTAQMVFLALGATTALLALPDPITSIDPEAFEILITLTLVLLLFSDASNVGLAQLLKAANLPLRLLLVGLPLTILAGALGAWGVMSPGGLGIACSSASSWLRPMSPSGSRCSATSACLPGCVVRSTSRAD